MTKNNAILDVNITVQQTKGNSSLLGDMDYWSVFHHLTDIRPSGRIIVMRGCRVFYTLCEALAYANDLTQFLKEHPDAT